MGIRLHTAGGVQEIKAPKEPPKKKQKPLSKGIADSLSDFTGAGPKEVLQWIASNQKLDPFAQSLWQWVTAGKSLTSKQVAVVQLRLEAPKVDSTLVKAAEEIMHYGKVYSDPDLIADVSYKLAGPKSANPGAIYVFLDGDYMGKITPSGELVGKFNGSKPFMAQIEDSLDRTLSSLMDD